jgi:hypothetical protein
VICTAAAGALNASFVIAPGGTAYSASVEVSGASGYGFWDTGPLGERIPRQVSNVSLHGDPCGNCSFDWADPFTMNFTEGNYTILYTGEILENHLQGTFEGPYQVSVTLPPGLDVRNPFLGMRSPGAVVRENGSSLDIAWNGTRSFEVRYYTPERERLLLVFGALWFLGLVLVLVPYLLERRMRGRGP